MKKLELYTINATPQRSLEQYQRDYRGAMPSSKRLNQSEVNRFNEIAHRGYAERVSEILAGFGVDGFTMQEVQGYWQGVPEKSYTITVALEAGLIVDVIAEKLRDEYGQDAVMVTYPDNTVKLIEREV